MLALVLPLAVGLAAPVALLVGPLALLSAARTNEAAARPAGSGSARAPVSVSRPVLSRAMTLDEALAQARARQPALRSALVRVAAAAADARFIPIAMTSLATVIGLIPTALGLEAGTESNRPLALAVVGGLTSSTMLSLFLVPTMFLPIAKRGQATDESTASPRFVEVPT